MNQSKRILIIGSIGHPKNTVCYGWNEIDKVPNIADYDVVIIDMTTLSFQSLRRLSTGNVHNMDARKMDMLLDSNGDLFVIAKSEFPLDDETQTSIEHHHWLPYHLDLIAERGETFREISPEFERYFKNTRTWTFTLDVTSIKDVIRLLIQKLKISVSLKIIAKNRYSKPLAAKVESKTRGNFYVLPKPTEISAKEGINILLEEFYRIRTTEQSEPDWARDIKIPGEIEFVKSIEEHRHQIVETTEEIKTLESQRRAITRFKALLYTEGYELEQIVRDTFREFGATIDDPAESGADDGRVITEYGKGVLEIKKKSKSASKSDVRQLDEWVGNCLAEGEEHKGLLVVNHYGDLPLENRADPYPDNVIAYARRVRRKPFCLLTTLELFKALCGFREKKINGKDILRSIFEADGVCHIIAK